jgi:hypothetical protein
MKLDRRFCRAVRTGIALLTFAGLSTAAPIVIDDFSVSQTLTVSGGSGLRNATPNGALAGIGGQREFSVTRSAGTGSGQLDSNNLTPGFLSFASSDTSDAQFLVVWDGANTAASPSASLDSLTNLTFGLGNVDLTDGGTNSYLRFRADADNNGDIPVTIRIYQSLNKYVQASAIVAGDIGFTLENHDLLYTSFVGFGLGPGETALDVIRNANAIALFGNPPVASDMSIDFVQAGAIPEPTTLTLLGSAILALGFVRRRRS